MFNLSASSRFLPLLFCISNIVLALRVLSEGSTTLVLRIGLVIWTWFGVPCGASASHGLARLYPFILVVQQTFLFRDRASLIVPYADVNNDSLRDSSSDAQTVWCLGAIFKAP